MNDNTLLEYTSSPRQLEHVEAYLKYGSCRKAGKALGIHQSRISESLRKTRARAAKSGHAPEFGMTQRIPDGYIVKGVSSLYGEDGQLKAQWVKSSLDRQQHLDAMREAVADLVENLHGLAPLSAVPQHCDDELLAVYPWGDPHWGMYAYAAESGDDFDLDIANDLHMRAVDRLVASAPNAKTGLLLNLGDFFHADDSTAETPGHGNKLDVDTRFAKVAQAGLRSLVRCIYRMLEKHEKVEVWNMIGNHDPHAAVWLSLCVDSYFVNDPRVTVDLNPSLYKFLRFGKVLIGAHHGHGAKANDLPLLMAADRPVDWGQTEFRHWLCGHIHHWTAKEHPGVVVETFRTLAAKDAWHAGKGYRSRRDMNCLVFHKDFGEIQRIKCDIAMLQAA